MTHKVSSCHIARWISLREAQLLNETFDGRYSQKTEWCPSRSSVSPLLYSVIFARYSIHPYLANMTYYFVPCGAPSHFQRISSIDGFSRMSIKEKVLWIFRSLLSQQTNIEYSKLCLSSCVFLCMCMILTVKTTCIVWLDYLHVQLYSLMSCDDKGFEWQDVR